MWWASLVAQWERTCLPMQEMQVQTLGQEDPYGRKWQLTSIFSPGKSHGQRSLVTYIPRDHRVGHDLATKTTTNRLWCCLYGPSVLGASLISLHLLHLPPSTWVDLAISFIIFCMSWKKCSPHRRLQNLSPSISLLSFGWAWPHSNGSRNWLCPK